MLALDSTIGCIEATEPDVLDMYRSAPVMNAPVAGSMTQSCEAYVCAIREKSRVHVYVALVADNKRIFVYRPSGNPDAEDEYHPTLQEAVRFAESLGFTPQRMNLNYSPAMREVVIRNIKILRPPGGATQSVLRHGMADAPASSGLTAPPALKKPASAVVHAASSALFSAAVAVASAQVPPRALSAATQEEPATALPALPEPAPPANVATLAEPWEVISRLTLENQVVPDEVREEVALLRQRLASARSDLQKANEQLASVRAECAEMQHARAKDAADSLSKLKEQMERELAALSAQGDAANRFRNGLEAQLAEQTEALSRAAEEIAALVVERDAARQRATHQSTVAGPPPEEMDATEASIGADEAAGQIAATATLPLGPALLPQQEDGFRIAPQQGTGLSPEAAASPAGHTELASPPVPPQQEGEAKLPGPGLFPMLARESSGAADWYAAPAPRPAKLPDTSDADRVFFPVEESHGGPGRFLLQPGLSAIECGSSTDVVQLHHSINHAYLSPEGRETASCQGYICALRTAGGALRVAVALFGTQCGRTWVFLPELQPENQQALAVTIAAAIEFTEGVGFIMEPVPLGPERRHHDEAVRRCKVLHVP